MQGGKGLFVHHALELQCLGNNSAKSHGSIWQKTRNQQEHSSVDGGTQRGGGGGHMGYQWKKPRSFITNVGLESATKTHETNQDAPKNHRTWRGQQWPTSIRCLGKRQVLWEPKNNLVVNDSTVS